ncbi:TonB-dependent receptor [Novosphingobium decolorationis]|uniref:TonB-dependent receptor n=1 Tax=Novosphingobium decolorationis TaxID=2698673 RepID=A0ABX8E4W3_9SPHN|nr:TonB-dependent receptor [Novosphingobium decolorationis]MED5544547.1 TonB-dependent receptor [Pseudomonadota bacterium]QVM83963.1 TonB-dependent receptor [Novosphingobium decolorationis]
MSIRGQFKAGLLCATGITCAALASPALADEAADVPADVAAPASAAAAADAPALVGSAIVVSATRRDTTIMETPINISAISGDDLQEQHIDDMRNLGAFTPGVTILDNGPRGAGTIVMRGLSASDTSATAGDNSNSAVGMYLGEVPMYYDFKLIDINRVETLLGPQGTLYGLGTLAGAMRNMPNRPDAGEFSFEGSGRVFDMAHSGDTGYNGYGVVNVPLVEDTIAFRSATGYYFTPGFIDYPYLLQEPGTSLPQPGGVDNPLGSEADQDANFTRGKDLNFERTFTTRNQLGFYADDLKVYVTYAHQETKTDGRSANGGGVVGEGRYEGPWRYMEPAKRSGDLLSLEVEGNVADAVNVVFVSAYTQRKAEYQGDNTDLLIDLDYDYEHFPGFSSYNQSNQKEHAFTNELRFVSTFDGPFSFVAGAFWNRQSYRSNYDEYVPGFPAWANENWGTDLETDPSVDGYAHEYSSFVRSTNDEKGLYGEASVHFTDDLQVTGGLRYYKYDAWVNGGSYLPLWDDDYSSRSGSTSKDGLVYKINASWNIAPEFMVYGTWSTGYRIGGVNRVAPCSQEVIDIHEAGGQQNGQTLCALPNELDFGPDETKNAEIGMRAQLFDNKLMLTLAAFHVSWDGIQLDGQTTYGAIGITSNGGKAVSKGIDVSFQAQPLPGLSIRGNYSYLDAHLTEDVPDLLSIAGGDLVGAFSGDRLPGSAKNKGAIGATYELPVGDNALNFGWTATYTGNILTRVGSRGGGEKLPDYWMHQANITYKTDRFDVGVFATNIFDTYAVTGVSNDLTRRNLVNDGVISRYYARSVAQPRTIGVQGTVRF